jgi:hypothetical protein
MKYLLCCILLVMAVGVAAPPLIYAHAITATPALFSGGCIAFACYLFDPTGFLAFMADARKTATCYFKKGDA